MAWGMPASFLLCAAAVRVVEARREAVAARGCRADAAWTVLRIMVAATTAKAVPQSQPPPVAVVVAVAEAVAGAVAAAASAAAAAA